MGSPTLSQSGSPTGSVLVVGSGISGITAATDLARSGFRVYLVEKGPAIGGKMAQLDKTFPTNDCSMCILSPSFTEVQRDINIDILTHCEVMGLEGEPGHFRAKLRRKPRYVDETKCNNCGTCTQFCPVRIPDSFNEGLAQTSCIHLHFPQAVPAVVTIDPDYCRFLNGKKCQVCQRKCNNQAIDFEQREEEIELEVGAVILAPGFDKFDARGKAELGYGIADNVLTSLEFERLLSASGPHQGHIIRPSDHTGPKRIAWIQCVGSRDCGAKHGWCSSVCCMYATKEAIIAKEHLPELEASIFYIDMRAFGKEFDNYYHRAVNDYGVRYIRSMVSSVKELQRTKNLLLAYVDQLGTKVEEEFDLVVLSVGFQPPKDAAELARNLDIELNEHGFCRTKLDNPLETTRPGVFVCGAFSGPKDIPDSVVQGSAAAASAGTLLAEARGTLMRAEEVAPERDVSDQEPRPGVFICHCGSNIAGVVRVPEVVEYAKGIEGVVHAESLLYACSQNCQAEIRKRINEHGLNRIVVAACSPRTHEHLFQECVAKEGLNPYLFEQANIRDHCSWVHMRQPDAATIKAQDLVRMAVARARLLKPLSTRQMALNHDAMVIGGGLAGMTAALELADQGFGIHLLESTPRLGGVARRLHRTLEGMDFSALVQEKAAAVERHPRISLHLNSKVIAAAGSIGHFRSSVAPREGTVADVKDIEHGVLIIATGAEVFSPDGWRYGQSPQVLTQLEMEERLAARDPALGQVRTVAMIQCVGSREEGRPYCSRLCCSQAVKNALALKELNPSANVYVFYRDMRTYGFKEDYYRQARAKGVIFIRYEPDRPPEVSPGPGNVVRLTVWDPTLRANLTLRCGLVVLAPAIIPAPGNKELAQLYKVSLTADGFFLEAHMKLRPVDFATEGVFMCGLAHGPKPLEESLAQAKAAAARAAAILSRETLTIKAAISEVQPDNCDGCGYCIEPCPFGALSLVEFFTQDGEVKKMAEVNEAKCKGCGVCMATCPKQGIMVRHFRLEQLSAQIDAALASR
ncbi:MAG: CoB--CoM heterodisulfide reductase iron-sulfur subunit A family protein [Pseudomonadota bacterium]